MPTYWAINRSLSREWTWPLSNSGTSQCPYNVHIISLQLVIQDDACEHWLIATEPSIEFKRTARRVEVKTELNTTYEDVRRWNFTSSIVLGGIRSKGGLRLDVTQQTSMLEIQRKTRKKILGLCLLSLSHHDTLFVFV